jgi:hypothetical protein
LTVTSVLAASQVLFTGQGSRVVRPCAHDDQQVTHPHEYELVYKL